MDQVVPRAVPTLESAVEMLESRRAVLLEELALIDGMLSASRRPGRTARPSVAPDVASERTSSVCGPVASVGRSVVVSAETARFASPAEVVDAAIEVLRRSDARLGRAALLDAVLRRGVRVAGADRAKNFGNILRRDGRIGNDGGYFVVADVPRHGGEGTATS